jgi:hypothetical protein
MVRNAASLILGSVLTVSIPALVVACGGDDSSDERDGASGAPAGGSPSGGSGGSAGSGGAAAGTGGAGPCVDPTTSCGAAPTGAPADTLLYDGAPVMDDCPKGISAPRSGFWFAYSDGSSTAPSQTTEFNGRGGADDCAFHTDGSGYTKYGAGAGFDLNYASMTACPYDASTYTGVRAYLKGTTSGTRAASYAPTPNSVRVKLVTSDDKVCPTSERSNGDDFGGWCTVVEDDWTLCDVPFATATREGFSTPYMATELDPTKLVKIQFEFAKEEMSPSVSYDVWIDDVEFY